MSNSRAATSPHPPLEVPGARPHLILRPRQRGVLIPIRDLIDFRDLLKILALRDVRLRYRQTVIGVLWVVLQPLMGAGVLTFVFGTVAGLSINEPGVPYLAFSLAGLLVWNAFIQVFQKATDSLTTNAQLVSKIYFPRIALPVSTTVGVLLDLVVGLGLMAAILIAFHVVPGPQLAFLPVATLLSIALGLGLGLATAALNVSFRDVRYVVPVVSQFLLYATPVAYSSDHVPQSARWFLEVNPMVGILELFRWCLLGGSQPDVHHVVTSVIAAAVALAMGAFVFQRTERKFADVI